MKELKTMGKIQKRLLKRFITDEQIIDGILWVYDIYDIQALDALERRGFVKKIFSKASWVLTEKGYEAAKILLEQPNHEG